MSRASNAARKAARRKLHRWWAARVKALVTRPDGPPSPERQHTLIRHLDAIGQPQARQCHRRARRRRDQLEQALRAMGLTLLGAGGAR